MGWPASSLASKELLRPLRLEVPDDKHNLTTDLFEKIVFYEYRVLGGGSQAKRRHGVRLTG